jgi:protein-tyrosine phosphatase
MSAKPELLPWGDPSAPGGTRTSAPAPSRGDRQRAAAALADGELVLIPTETVYGIAARADIPQAVARLRALKDRGAEEPLTWHIGALDALERLPRVAAMARRLIARYWPGPLTLVLPGVPRGLEAAAKDGWIGVRFPAQRSTAQLLAGLDFPVVATSANRRGAAPIADAAEAAQAFAGELDLVLDGGPPRLGEASAVLKVGPGHFELLRPGLLDLEALRAAAGISIAFVCTGNTCRSPMAEALARAALVQRLSAPGRPARLPDFGVSVTSMGVLAGPGMPVAEHAVATLAARGLDVSGQRSRGVVPEEIARMDRVYGLTHGHLEALRLLLPPGRSQHCELLDPDGGEVQDPIGGTRADYERCAEEIQRLVERRVDEWV